jgi:hypothetical protein
MIPAFIVQSWLDKFINTVEDDTTLRLLTKAGEDMNLLTVNDLDDDGNPIDITWIKIT